MYGFRCLSVAVFTVYMYYVIKILMILFCDTEMYEREFFITKKHYNLNYFFSLKYILSKADKSFICTCSSPLGMLYLKLSFSNVKFTLTTVAEQYREKTPRIHSNCPLGCVAHLQEREIMR